MVRVEQDENEVVLNNDLHIGAVNRTSRMSVADQGPILCNFLRP